MRGNNKITRAVGDIITKLTILWAVTIISTTLILGAFPQTFTYFGIFIDTVINTVCLLLSFALNDKYYRKLCACCISCNNKCKKQPEIKTIEEETKESVQLHASSGGQQSVVSSDANYNDEDSVSGGRRDSDPEVGGQVANYDDGSDHDE